MIVERYLLREILITFVGVSTLLVLLFFSGTFIRILSDAAEGEFPVDVVLALFGLKSVGNLIFMLPIAFYFTVMLALGRLYKDSEMIALHACGIGMGRIVGTVLTISLVLALGIGWMSLSFAPWADREADRVVREAQARSEIEGLLPGRFNQIDDGLLVYVEQLSDGGRTMRNIFVRAEMDGTVTTLSARSGRQTVDAETGGRFLVLEDGYRYEGEPSQEGYRIVQFEQHGVRLVDREVVPGRSSHRTKGSLELYRSEHPREQAELQWRLTAPLAVLLLGLVAVPLARTSPRQGRYGALFVGILLFVLYYNLLTMARSALGRGEIPPEAGLWWVHALLLALALAMLRRQSRLRAPRSEAAG